MIDRKMGNEGVTELALKENHIPSIPEKTRERIS
jgi:hypothetical protein